MNAVAVPLESASARRHLELHVARALFRLRLQEALCAGTFIYTLLLWLLPPLILLDKLIGLRALGLEIWVLWPALAGLGIPYVILRAWSGRLNGQLAAVLTDERLGLHARLSTALALDPAAESQFGEAFYAEAARNLARLDAARAFPLRLPGSAWLLPLPALLAGALLYLVPQQDKLGLLAAAQQQRMAEETKRDTLQKFGRKLEHLKKEIDDSKVDADTAQYQVNQLVRKAENVAKQVQEGKRNPEEAIVAMADLKREIGEEKAKLTEGKDFLSRLQDLKDKDLNLEEDARTRQICQALQSGDAAQAAREMRKLARKLKQEVLENPELSPAQKAQAMKDLQKEVEKLAGALAEQEALRENLKEISQKAMESGEFQALQNQVKEFMNKNPDAQQPGDQAEELAESMDQAAEELERLEDENKVELSETEQEAQEQLEGLEEALEESMEGLNSSCQGGQCEGQSGGKQAGGSAKGQGKKLAGKSGKQAQGQAGKSGRQAGQNGSSQGNQKGAGPVQPNFSGPNGGGPGAGLRAYRDGDAWFKVEKVEGKLQSGAITGLSHFRGQGAKGEAPREYMEALKSAEQEATSALELERIPADARNMVKEYFSKLRSDAGLKESPLPTSPGAGTPASGTRQPEAKPERGQELKE